MISNSDESVNFLHRNAVGSLGTDGKTGSIYYYNTETKQSSWTKPVGFDVDISRPPPAPPPKKRKTGGESASSSQPKLGEVVEGTSWTLNKDPSSGKQFFTNTETGESVWEVPAELEGKVNLGGSDESDENRWRCTIDLRSGDAYYFRKVSGDTSWDKPWDFAGETEVIGDEIIPGFVEAEQLAAAIAAIDE